MPPIKRGPECDGDESQINVGPQEIENHNHSNENKSVFHENHNFYSQKNIQMNEEESGWIEFQMGHIEMCARASFPRYKAKIDEKLRQ